MRSMLGLLVTTTLLAGAAAAVPASAWAQEAEWTTLFDGSSLDGWQVVGNANWELGDGAVSADEGSGFLLTEESYGDFELSVEFWVDEPANSGIYTRCQDPGMIRDTNCYEVNIYDTRADQTYRTGGIVHIASPSEVIDAGGQWNTFLIRAEGSQLVVTLNGTRIVDADDGQFQAGPIALQYGAGLVRFRSVRIREL